MKFYYLVKDKAHWDFVMSSISEPKIFIFFLPERVD